MLGFSKLERARRAAERGDAESQMWLGYAYEVGQGVQQDYAEAMKWYRLGAAQGHAASQCNLGVMYQNGEGVPQDYSEAASLFYRAAVQGYAPAQFNLAGLYGTGRGVPLDYAEAAKWYRLAAEQGVAAAKDILDTLERETNNLTPQKIGDAELKSAPGTIADGAIKETPALELEKLERAAEMGDADAQCTLGWFYATGLGVTRDYTEAVKWYQRAAEQGYRQAQVNLGLCYQEGRGVPQDYPRAVGYFRLAAKDGHSAGQILLANAYTLGLGVAQDDAAAAALYRSAADQKEPLAERQLALAYANGRGVSKNYEEAAKWYLRAAEQGDAVAQHGLGVCYFRGDGVAQDYYEAAKWYQLAAKQGHAEAACGLADLYLKGRGVARDPVVAYAWFEIAADKATHSDLERIVGYRDTVAARMDRAQIAAAERLVIQWRNGWRSEETRRWSEQLLSAAGLPAATAGKSNPEVQETSRQQTPRAATSPEVVKKDVSVELTIQREKRSLFGRKLSTEAICKKAYSILGEILVTSAHEGWSFSDFAKTAYIGFSENGATVTARLSDLQASKDIICWIKLSEIALLQAVRPPMLRPLPAVPQELMFAATELAHRLTED